MQDKEQEKTHFDEFTKTEPWHTFTDGTYDKIVKLFQRFNPERNSIVIDMGCGTGELTDRLSRQFSNVAGFDVSEGCVAMAKKTYPGVNFQVVDIENTKLEDNSVDALFYCGILHHFINFEGVIKEAKRIIKKDGKIFIFEPNAANPAMWLFRDKKSPFKSNKLKTPNEEFLTRAKIKGAFERENFRVVKINCISGISYTRTYFKKLFSFPFYFVVYAYNLFEFILDKTPLRANHGSFIYGYITKS